MGPNENHDPGMGATHHRRGRLRPEYPPAGGPYGGPHRAAMVWTGPAPAPGGPRAQAHELLMVARTSVQT
jgi:hypothetical protein